MTTILEPLRVGDYLRASAVVRLVRDGNGDPEVYLLSDGGHAVIGVKYGQIASNGDLYIRSSKPGPVTHAVATIGRQATGYKGIVCGLAGGGPGSYVGFFDARIDRRLDLNDPSDYDRLLTAGKASIWYAIEWYVPLPPEPLPPHPENTAWREYPRTEPVCYQEEG